MYRLFCLCAVAATTVLLGTTQHASADGDVFVTPRFWYALTGDKRFNSTGSSIDSSEVVPVALYGGTVTYVPRTGGTSYSLTGFYGSGTGDHREVGPVGEFRGTLEIKRLDLEGLVQVPIEGTAASLGYGLRYVDIGVGATGTDQAHVPFRFHDDIKLYLAELGFQVSAPLDKGGKFRLFGNLNGVFGYRDQKHSDSCCAPISGATSAKSGGVIGVDTNAGFAAELVPNLTLTGRYRLFVISDVDFNFVRETDLVHGPEVNLTLKLN